MKVEKLTPTLSDEETKMYQENADKLAAREKVSKVHPVVLIDPDTHERTVAYLREPNYLTKIRVMDKATSSGVFSAADELREASTIKDASDAITYGEGSESDIYKMGITDYCLNMVNRLQNQFKKK